MRCVDLIKRRGDVIKGWDPVRDTHRGRLRIEMIRYEDGRDKNVKLVLVQKPSQTDPAEERRYEKGFFIDRKENSLSAGVSAVANAEERSGVRNKGDLTSI